MNKQDKLCQAKITYFWEATFYQVPTSNLHVKNNPYYLTNTRYRYGSLYLKEVLHMEDLIQKVMEIRMNFM